MLTSPPVDFLQISECLNRVAQWVPHQGPIKDFIHHNTLHAFGHFPFYEGCLRASRLYGAWAFFPLDRYRELLGAGEIEPSAVSEVLSRSELPVAVEIRDLAPEDGWLDLLHSNRWGDYFPQPGLAERGLRSRWRSVHGLKLHHRIHSKLFRLFGQFLDQGIAMWEPPSTGHGLFAFVRDLVKDSWMPLRPWSLPSARDLLLMSPEESIHFVLTRFLGSRSEALQERYLLELCLAHPGWSGMISELEHHPENLLEPRRISLAEACALELIAEYAYVVMDLGPDFPLLVADDTNFDPLPYESTYRLEVTKAEQVAQLWQQSYERTYRKRLLSRLASHRAARPLQPQAETSPKLQAFFCMDDREGSLRRHLEAQDPAIETFGFAGFFGVDCVFQGIDDAFPSKHCPAPVHPKHRIREYRIDSRRDSKSLRLHEVHDHSHSLMRGFVISQTLGLWSAVKLALSIFRPSLNPLATSSLHRVDKESTLEIHRTTDQVEEGFFSGYSDEEMADRVERVLRSCGLSANPLAPLVLFVGHGASSINNPYFSAYDCGACSGRGGGPNARAVAMMANRGKVRLLLAERGIEIPDSTWFLGSLHDTTRDEMLYFDTESIPRSHDKLFHQLHHWMETAVALNAQERCRRFSNVTPRIDPRHAILAVRRRSVSIFEPRPELNHATNAACVVGRRWLTKGLSLHRRCFLNSYEPAVDPDGEILASLLSALIPVGGGINLEYYFSRLDPEAYGAGSKLPHNIQGLIGVINGTEGDLLTGLPTQMTEVHDPLRLLFIVEQTPTLTLKAVKADPAIYQWVEQSWIQFLCWDYQSGTFHEFQDGEFRPVLAESVAR